MIERAREEGEGGDDGGDKGGEGEVVDGGCGRCE